MYSGSRIGMRRNAANETGQAIIEFALIAIVFFGLLLGIIEFAILLFNQQVITNAGREGARFGVVARPVDLKVTRDQIIAETKNFAQSHVVSFGNKSLSVDAQFASGLQSCEKTQDVLTVTVDYSHSFLFLFSASKTMRTQARMICE